MKTLMAHQDKAIGSLRLALVTGSRRPMLQAPTGAGKTVLAAAIIRRALERNNRVIFTVPAISLVDQAAQEFFKEGITDIGVMQGDHPMTDASKPVQIASIQTLMRRKIPPADLVLVDEAHRVFDFVGDWMARDEWLSVPFIGLSATPWTKGLGRLYDKLIVAATTSELIDLGLLSPFKVFAPSHPDLSKVRTVAGDYHEGDLSGVMMETALTADIVRTWQERGEGRPTLCFAVDRAHAKALQTEFLAAGIPCGYMDANTERADRNVIAGQFARGELKVVANVGVLTTGVDWDVRCVILARPTKSEMLYVQIVGRGLRTATGKSECLVLDHSDTTLRLGFVTDIHHDRLDDGTLAPKQKPGELEALLPKECKKCHFVRAPKIPACPACGFKPERKSDIEVREGELIELDAKRRKLNRDAGWPEKVAFIAQVRAHAIVKGKSDGWVSHLFKAKFGVWPNDPRVRYAKAAAGVSAEVAAYIQSRNIAFAKAKQKAMA